MLRKPFLESCEERRVKTSTRHWSQGDRKRSCSSQMIHATNAPAHCSKQRFSFPSVYLSRSFATLLNVVVTVQFKICSWSQFFSISTLLPGAHFKRFVLSQSELLVSTIDDICPGELCRNDLSKMTKGVGTCEIKKVLERRKQGHPVSRTSHIGAVHYRQRMHRHLNSETCYSREVS